MDGLNLPKDATDVFVNVLRWDEQPTQSPKGSEQIVQTRPILS